MRLAKDRIDAFCARFSLRAPVLLAPMSGASAPSLSIAIANSGGLAACGALLMQPAEITAWANEVRSGSNGAFQINLWIPEPAPKRDTEHEARVREFLSAWGPTVPTEAGDTTLPDFAAQCEALLAIAPSAVSSVMGLYPPEFVAKLKERGIAWIANVTTVAEAGGSGRRRCDRRARSGSWRTPRLLQRGGCRKKVGRIVRFVACGSGRGERASRSYGRNCRRTGSGCGTYLGRERSTNRDRISAMLGSEDPSCVGQNSRPNNTGTNCCYAGVQRARGTKHCDKLCSCCDG